MKIIKFKKREKFKYRRKVIIKDLILNILVGIHSFEKKKKQRVKFNIEILTDPYVSPNRKMKEAASNLEFEEAAKLRDEMRKLEASELEITLNPKISQYNLKSKVYPKGRSTMGMPGTKPRKAIKKWKPKK